MTSLKHILTKREFVELSVIELAARIDEYTLKPLTMYLHTFSQHKSKDIFVDKIKIVFSTYMSMGIYMKWYTLVYIDRKLPPEISKRVLADYVDQLPPCYKTDWGAITSVDNILLLSKGIAFYSIRWEYLYPVSRIKELAFYAKDIKFEKSTRSQDVCVIGKGNMEKIAFTLLGIDRGIIWCRFYKDVSDIIQYGYKKVIGVWSFNPFDTALYNKRLKKMMTKVLSDGWLISFNRGHCKDLISVDEIIDICIKYKVLYCLLDVTGNPLIDYVDKISQRMNSNELAILVKEHIAIDSARYKI